MLEICHCFAFLANPSTWDPWIPANPEPLQTTFRGSGRSAYRKLPDARNERRRDDSIDSVVALMTLSLQSAMLKEFAMPQLLVRNLSEDLVKALKQQAALHDRSAEQEHREILKAALAGKPARRSLADALAAIPNVGEDADFCREQQDNRGDRVSY